ARRAASICLAVIRPGSIAFMPKAPKSSEKPPLATPLIRPLWAFLNFVRFGESILLFPIAQSGPALGAGTLMTRALALILHGALVHGHRVVGHDLALEHPHLDTAGAVGGLRGTFAVIDLGAQRV